MRAPHGTAVLAAVIALCLGGAVGVGCGSSGSSATESTATESSSSTQTPRKPHKGPRIPPKGGETTTEPTP